MKNKPRYSSFGSSTTYLWNFRGLYLSVLICPDLAPATAKMDGRILQILCVALILGRGLFTECFRAYILILLNCDIFLSWLNFK